MSSEVTTAVIGMQSADNEVRKEAEAFLLQFQRTRRAWEVCLDLLQSPTTQSSVCLFAAQTLHSKAARDFVQSATQRGSHNNTEGLSMEEWNSLILPVAALATKAVDRPQRTQLCVALAALLLRSDSAPASAVSGALGQLQGSPALFDFIAVLPDEWARASLRVTPPWCPVHPSHSVLSICLQSVPQGIS